MKLKGSIAKKEIKSLQAVHFTTGHHKVPRIWIIIADKKIARIYSKAGGTIKLLGEALPSSNGKSILENTEIGRTTSESLHIKYEPSMSPVRRRAFKFAHEIADWLDHALQKDGFDRLITVAPPQMLGDFRIAFGKPVASRLVAEINKDLTKMPEKELCERLKELI